MNKIITLDNIDFSNKNFWTCFTASAFPTALDEETDMSLTEIITEYSLADIEWWDNFTGYYNGIFNYTDGYIDDPVTFSYNLTPIKSLKIEFHPGGILYYINNIQAGRLDAEYDIHIFPFKNLLEYTKENPDKHIFMLLLPLTAIEKPDMENTSKIIQGLLNNFFDVSFCKQLARSIVYGLVPY